MTATDFPIQLNEIDRQIWREELDPVVPQRIFDVHTHVYRNEHVGAQSPERA